MSKSTVILSVLLSLSCIITFWAVAVCLSVSLQSKQAPDRNPTYEHNLTNQSQISSMGSVADDKEYSTGRRNQHKEKDHSIDPNWIIVLLTIILAFYTASSAKSAAKNADAAMMSAEANRESATHAKVALDATITISRMDQRAWVGITGIRISRPELGKAFPAEICFSNSGKSFANNVSGNVHALSMKTPVEDGKKFFDGANKRFGRTLIGPSSIAPSGEFRYAMLLANPVSGELLEMIENGPGKLYLVGEITYTDIFGESHATRFFVHYSIAFNTMQTEKTYNDAT